jgi:hypothetical protein
MPAQNGFLSGSWQHFQKGARIRLKGDFTLRKTEQGWRIEAFDIKSYQVLAESGPTEPPPSVTAPTTPATNPQNPQDLETLNAAVEEGKDVAFKVKYDSAVNPYHYLHDGVLTVSKTAVTFSGEFTVSPDNS